MPEAYREAAPADADVADAAPAAREDWWALFDDPALTELVGRVRANNHELLAALQRLEQARALLDVSRSAGQPQVALEPSWRRAQTSDAVEFLPGVTNGRTQNTSTVVATAAWELDLFGRIRRGNEAALADAEAAAADADALLLLLSTEAARGYLGVRALDRELEVVRRAVETRREGVALLRKRFELGATSELDVARAETQLAQAEADLAALERARAPRPSTRSRCSSASPRRPSRCRPRRSAANRPACRRGCPRSSCARAPTCAAPSAGWPPRTRASASPPPRSTRASR
ncbi:MAG: TolC family protein [Planctomycetes bacterium]|nr:TolC family protein [Planctomycetota bacterium]